MAFVYISFWRQPVFRFVLHVVTTRLSKLGSMKISAPAISCIVWISNANYSDWCVAYIYSTKENGIRICIAFTAYTDECVWHSCAAMNECLVVKSRNGTEFNRNHTVLPPTNHPFIRIIYIYISFVWHYNQFENPRFRRNRVALITNTYTSRSSPSSGSR